MKMIVAILRPEKLGPVRAALNPRDLYLMTVSEVLDCDQEQASTEFYRGREYRRPASRLRLEIAVEDALLDATVEAVLRAGFEGVPGRVADSQVFVMGLEDAIRLRCGERGLVAVAH
jgi:nitrogen regulatory protein P-II 1